MADKAFNEVKKELFPTLELYVPIVARVHGKHHPEFYEVGDLFEVINKKVASEKPELNEEFAKLRKITDNYKVPNDVCESYEAVYNMLEQLDKAYKE